MTRLRKLPIKVSAGLGLSLTDRAVKEAFAARCMASDLEELRNYFEAGGEIRCFYCDAPEPSRWDHLHAVTRGGDTVPGNLVPACGRCDDSKQDRDIDEWVRSTSKHRTPTGHLAALQDKVAAYRERFFYTEQAFETRLTPDQLACYQRFRTKIDTLRRHLESEGLLRPSTKRVRS
ncbi:HNH endonuclease signature motif containing protein [Luteimonas sp BLCC-B24]|uniref:HNH endonuclease n=1 Tax=Luteimonas sp. BLCC-B24 TaxID=3025317 RepID=UPI00234CDDB1|nr:HNH endonuclease signature motif containing protein [Luteimonas sp. BLCC-B24]MDC7805267.1 HNH endonuclease signature motif containing protein [Luteimonas sp. BLCC-B24]